MAIIIDGLKIANEFSLAIRSRVKNLKKNGINPKLVTISLGEDDRDNLFSSRRNELAKFVDSYLTKKRSELFFGEFNVQLESHDIYEINQIIDALTVKFYQEVIYAITTFFATQQKIIIIKPNGAMDGYLFKFRYMNILEKDKFKNGKLPVNVTE